MAPLLDALLLPKEYYAKMSVRKRTYFLCVFAIGALNLGYVFVYHRFGDLFLGKSLPDVIRNVALTLAFMLIVGLVDSFVFCRPLIDVLSRIPGLGRSDDSAQPDAASHAQPEAPPSEANPSEADPSESNPSDENQPGAASRAQPDAPPTASNTFASEANQTAAPTSSDVRLSAPASRPDSLAFVRAAKVYTISALIVTPAAVLIQEAYTRLSSVGGAGVGGGGAQVDVIVGALGVMQIWMFGIMTRGMCGILGCKGVQRALAFFVIAAWAVIWSVTFSWLTIDNRYVMSAVLKLFA